MASPATPPRIPPAKQTNPDSAPRPPKGKRGVVRRREDGGAPFGDEELYTEDAGVAPLDPKRRPGLDKATKPPAAGITMVPPPARHPDPVPRRTVRVRRRAPSVDTVLQRVQGAIGNYPASYLDSAIRNACTAFNTTMFGVQPWQAYVGMRSCVCQQPIFVAKRAPAGLMGKAAECGIIFVVDTKKPEDWPNFGSDTTIAVEAAVDSVKALAACVRDKGATVVFSEAAVNTYAESHGGKSVVELLWENMYVASWADPASTAYWDRVKGPLTRVFDELPAVVFEGPCDRSGVTHNTVQTAFDLDDRDRDTIATALNASKTEWAEAVTPDHVAVASAFVTKYGRVPAPRSATVVEDDEKRHKLVVASLLRSAQAGQSLPFAMLKLKEVTDDPDTLSVMASFVRIQDGHRKTETNVYAMAENVLRANGGTVRRRGRNCNQCGCVCGVLNDVVKRGREGLHLELPHPAATASKPFGCHRCMGSLDVGAPVALCAPMTGDIQVRFCSGTPREFSRTLNVATGFVEMEDGTLTYVTADPLTATVVGITLGDRVVPSESKDGTIDLTDAEEVYRKFAVGSYVLSPVDFLVRAGCSPVSTNYRHSATNGCDQHWTWEFDASVCSARHAAQLEHPTMACKGCVAEAIARGDMVMCFTCGTPTERHNTFASREMLETGIGGVMCSTCAAVNPGSCFTCGVFVTPVTMRDGASQLPWVACATCRGTDKCDVCCVPFDLDGTVPADVFAACGSDALRLLADHDTRSSDGWIRHFSACCPYTKPGLCVATTALAPTADATALRDMEPLVHPTNRPSWVDEDAFKATKENPHRSGIDAFPCGCLMDKDLPRAPQYVSCNGREPCLHNPGTAPTGRGLARNMTHMLTRNTRAKERLDAMSTLPDTLSSIKISVRVVQFDIPDGEPEPRVPCETLMKWVATISRTAVAEMRPDGKGLLITVPNTPTDTLKLIQRTYTRGVVEAAILMTMLENLPIVFGVHGKISVDDRVGGERAMVHAQLLTPLPVVPRLPPPPPRSAPERDLAPVVAGDSQDVDTEVEEN